MDMFANGGSYARPQWKRAALGLAECCGNPILRDRLL
jgi:hypothetical protein